MKNVPGAGGVHHFYRKTGRFEKTLPVESECAAGAQRHGRDPGENFAARDPAQALVRRGKVPTEIPLPERTQHGIRPPFETCHLTAIKPKLLSNNDARHRHREIIVELTFKDLYSLHS